MADDGQMVMAGLWAKWKDPKSGDEIQSCTILTTRSNEVMAQLHDRMPVILDKTDWLKWLGEEPATDEELLAMLRPSPDQVLKVWPVDKKVGNVRNRGAELALPVR
jgi:putative SOS response-associated peptidase YedK